MKFNAKGIIPAMVTPLKEDGEVNTSALSELVNFFIKSKVHGLFVIGSTGESYGLNYEQKKLVIKKVVEEVQGRIPVYVGTGAITTKDTIRLTKMAEKLGADAVSIVTPFFINPSSQELYEHYKNIAESVNIPVLIYNNPGKTGVNISSDLLVRLSKIENIVGIKDTSGDMTLTGEYIRRTDDDFNVLAGKDTLILSTLVYGGQGAITSTANVAPELPVKIYEEYIKGNINNALKAQFKLAPLRLAFSLGTFPVVMKEGLKLRGIDVGSALKPVNELSAENRNKLKNVLKEIGVL